MEMSEKEGDFMHAIKVIYEWDWFGYAGNDEFKGSSLKAYRGKKREYEMIHKYWV